MKKKYQGSTNVKRAQLLALRRDFETLQMKEGESVTNYCARTMEICNKMRFHGENMGDVSSLLVHEQKMNRSSNYDEQSLKASTFISSPNSRGRGGGRGRGRGRGDRGGRDSGRNFKANNDQSQGKEEKSNYAENKEGETLFMAIQVEKETEQDVWYLDTSCTNHMTGSKSGFSYLNEDFHSKVSFGDCSTVDATEKGDIKIKTNNGFVETISNVLYVPDLKSNLLSVGQLQEKGHVLTIKKGKCEIYDPVRGAIEIIQMSSNRLFSIMIDSMQSCLMTEVKDPSWLWHFCYGHLSFGGLKKL
uniref:Retrovirus-related Pol polyprotein from transposon TNT 1-94-like beta-barrel domain-containing protein n=1 Tax=Nicotiana tabacum TaxID=4097 RepID=A0A1S4C2C7_TOBAC|nr:PREDICTED: uncharacterized protein LOC107814410 [Nicotiana tabacum]